MLRAGFRFVVGPDPSVYLVRLEIRTTTPEGRGRARRVGGGGVENKAQDALGRRTGRKREGGPGRRVTGVGMTTRHAGGSMAEVGSGIAGTGKGTVRGWGQRHGGEEGAGHSGGSLLAHRGGIGAGVGDGGVSPRGGLRGLAVAVGAHGVPRGVQGRPQAVATRDRKKKCCGWCRGWR